MSPDEKTSAQRLGDLALLWANGTPFHDILWEAYSEGYGDGYTDGEANL